MKEPLFSVIVPAYDAADYLPRCVGSILGQSFPDFELLLVNDGSRDDTPALCEQYARRDGRVRVFHQENRGHTGARNTGLRESRGQYVLFVDSDDWLDSDVLARLCAEIGKEAPEILVFDLCRHEGPEVSILPNGVAAGVYSVPELEDRLLVAADGSYVFPKSLSGKAFLKSSVEKYQLSVPKEVLIGEDGACFVATAMTCQKICVLSGTGYHFAVRPGSVSHSWDQTALQRCAKLLQYYREHLDLSREGLRAQYERAVVAQLYTAVRFATMAGCTPAQIKADLRAVLREGGAGEALHRAGFGRGGQKMKVKQLILRFRLLWLVKPLMRQ